ncbi:hypothetical protein J2W28_006968 [Variovorax boronicumulans]|uniref:hypothetical protein n=1 Tax=Variovorax boronicumulans TaxID=436515 RepID=UPI002780EC6A|nr:hypothetical protein [Variovorax boronicumulans]MDP9996453.1 hypothetical protein [Variovorax boronicumulans]MDQ0007789.1 hypothetical protein [Variovorax boronicumulans]
MFVEFPKQPDRSGVSMGPTMIGGFVGGAIEQYRGDVYLRGQEFLSKLQPEKRTDFAALFREEFLKRFAREGGMLTANAAPGTITIGFTDFAVVYGANDATSSYRPITIILMTASNDRREVTKGFGRPILGRNPKAPTFSTLASVLEQPEVIMENLKISTIDMAQQAAAMVAIAQRN